MKEIGNVQEKKFIKYQIKFMYVLSSIVLPSLKHRLLLIDFNTIEP